MQDPYAGRFPVLRCKRERAGIVHKQFLLLKKDIPEANSRLKDLLDNAKKAYGVASKLVDAERLSKGEIPYRKNRPKEPDTDPDLADTGSRRRAPGPA